MQKKKIDLYFLTSLTHKQQQNPSAYLLYNPLYTKIFFNIMQLLIKHLLHVKHIRNTLHYCTEKLKIDSKKKKNNKQYYTIYCRVLISHEDSPFCYMMG